MLLGGGATRPPRRTSSWSPRPRRSSGGVPSEDGARGGRSPRRHGLRGRSLRKPVPARGPLRREVVLSSRGGGAQGRGGLSDMAKGIQEEIPAEEAMRRLRGAPRGGLTLDTFLPNTEDIYCAAPAGGYRKEVVLCGWVHRRRTTGARVRRPADRRGWRSRDRSRHLSGSARESRRSAGGVRPLGARRRPPPPAGTEKPDLPTGEVEVSATRSRS